MKQVCGTERNQNNDASGMRTDMLIRDILKQKQMSNELSNNNLHIRPREYGISYVIL